MTVRRNMKFEVFCVLFTVHQFPWGSGNVLFFCSSYPQALHVSCDTFTLFLFHLCIFLLHQRVQRSSAKRQKLPSLRHLALICLFSLTKELIFENAGLKKWTESPERSKFWIWDSVVVISSCWRCKIFIFCKHWTVKWLNLKRFS